MSDDTTDNLTAIERLEARIKTIPRTRGGRLTQDERCGAFYAMKKGYPQNLIARAFGITETTASLLAHCLANNRYNDVAAEFRRLGDAFGERYYTIEIDDRIARFRMNEITEEDRARRSFGPSKSADKWAGSYEIDNGDAYPFTLRIYWTETGWTASMLPAGRDTEDHDRRRWKTSADVKKALFDEQAIIEGFDLKAAKKKSQTPLDTDSN